MPRSTSQLGAGLYAASLSMTHHVDLAVGACLYAADSALLTVVILLFRSATVAVMESSTAPLGVGS